MKKSKYKWISAIVAILLSIVSAFFIISLERTLSFQVIDTSSNNSSWLLTQPIAQKGYHSQEVLENSIESFLAAIKKGYAIKMDLALTLDNQVVVVDYEFFSKNSPNNKSISTYTLEELPQISFLEKSYDIPTLKDALAVIDRQTPILFNIQTKDLSHKIDQLTYDIIKDYKGPIALESKNPISIKWFAQNAPDLPRGIILYGDFSLDIFNRFFDNIKIMYSKPNFVAYKYENLAKTDFSQARSKGLIVLGWTAKEEVLTTREFTDYCDNIILEAQD